MLNFILINVNYKCRFYFFLSQEKGMKNVKLYENVCYSLIFANAVTANVTRHRAMTIRKKLV